MTIELLEKELKSGKLNSLYLLYGEEKFLLESCMKKIKSLFGECINGINYIVIEEQNISQIISNIETPSFGYEKKLIIIKNTGLLKKEGRKKNTELSNIKENLAKYINNNIKLLKQSVVLVFIEDDIEKKALYLEIEKNGIVCEFLYQKPMQIEKRIKSICNAYKIQIDTTTIKYFIECCGTDMQILINEIRKLIEYKGENGIIKKEDIDILSTKKMESVIFDLTDNLGKKNIADSLKILQNLIYNKEPVIKILITLYNHFRKIYITKVAVRTGKDLTSSLNLKPNQLFLTSKYKMQAQYFEEKELKQILENLCDLDYNFKQGKIDLQIGLESILCKVTG